MKNEVRYLVALCNGLKFLEGQPAGADAAELGTLVVTISNFPKWLTQVCLRIGFPSSTWPCICQLSRRSTTVCMQP